jgi:MFS family permease
MPKSGAAVSRGPQPEITLSVAAALRHQCKPATPAAQWPGQGDEGEMSDERATGDDTSLSGARLALVALAACWLMAYLDRQIIALLATSIKHSLQVTDVELGVLQGIAFSGIYILVALPGGRLADRANRRNIILFGVITWSLATIGCGLARTYHELIVARAVMGLGEACLGPASISMIADYFARSRRGRAIGVVTGAATVGSAASSVLGGIILTLCGGAAVAIPLIGLSEPWQVTFMALGAPGLVVALLLMMVREPPRRQAQAPALPGATPDGGFGRLLLRRWRFFVPVYLALLFSVFAGFGGAAWMATVAIRRYALSPAYVGLVGGTITLAMAVVAPFAVGVMSDWAGKRWPGVGRMGLIAVLFLAQIPLICGWAFLPVPFSIFLVFSVLNGAIGSGLPSSGYIVLQEVAPGNMRAQAVAVFQILSNVVGMGFGPIVIAMVTEYVFRDEMMIGYAVASVSLICVVLGFLASLSAVSYLRSLRGQDDGSGRPVGQLA